MLGCASHQILFVLRRGVDLSKENMTAENFYNIFNALINSKNSNDAVTKVKERGEEIRDLLQKILDREKTRRKTRIGIRINRKKGEGKSRSKQ